MLICLGYNNYHLSDNVALLHNVMIDNDDLTCFSALAATHCDLKYNILFEALSSDYMECVS